MPEKERKPLARKETEAHKATLFADYTAPQVWAIRMGTPAYQMIHPYNKEMRSGTASSHYKTLVQPTMSKHNKSMASHLGMPATQIGGKLGNI
jgi:hypothetical protein